MAWSMVDNGHVPFVVALAGGRRQVVQPFDLLGVQLDAVGRDVLLDASDPLGAGDRGDVVALRQQPGQSDHLLDMSPSRSDNSAPRPSPRLFLLFLSLLLPQDRLRDLSLTMLKSVGELLEFSCAHSDFAATHAPS